MPTVAALEIGIMIHITAPLTHICRIMTTTLREIDISGLIF